METKELDVVLLKDGRNATILEVFDQGAAFLVEVIDDEGKTIDMPIIRHDEIEKMIYRYS